MVGAGMKPTEALWAHFVARTTQREWKYGKVLPARGGMGRYGHAAQTLRRGAGRLVGQVGREGLPGPGSSAVPFKSNRDGEARM